MILYVSQAMIRLRRQSGIGRVSHRTVCRIVPAVRLFAISRSAVFSALIFSCYILFM